MGPWIILDKCVLQALPQRAVYELGRYFTVNIPPILLLETLADLSRPSSDPAAAEREVGIIAAKALPDSICANMSYQQLCLSSLMGIDVPMMRKGIKGGGQVVTSETGEKGVVWGVSPENLALLRWREGTFSEQDVKFARNWRANIAAIDLEKAQRDAAKISKRKLTSLQEVKELVDTLPRNTHAQGWLLGCILGLLRFSEDYNRTIRQRWKTSNHVSVATFAPYAWHCARVQLIFHIGLTHKLVGTKRSNLIDIEYLYYSPFCEVFTTRDDFLEGMARLILEPDQSLIHGDDLRDELKRLADFRRGTDENTKNGWKMPYVEPGQNSCIHKAWIKHRHRFIPQAQPRSNISPEQSAAMMAKLKPVINAMEAAIRNRPPEQPWPPHTQ